MAGKRAGFGGNAFLQASISGQANHVLIEDPMLRRVEPRRAHFGRYRNPDSVTDPLPERAGGAFDTRGFKKLRMPRRLAMQLPESFNLRHRQVVAAHMQPCVKKHAAVPR